MKTVFLVCLTLFVSSANADDKDLASIRTYRPIKSIKHGTTRLLDESSLLLLGAGTGATLASLPFDSKLSSHYKNENIWENYATLGNKYLGSGIPGAVFGLGAVGYGYYTSSAHSVETGTAVLESLVMTGLYTSVIKFAVNRKRPGGGKFSFPSGHTSTMFAWATSMHIMVDSLPVDIVMFSLAAYTGMARVVSYKHFLSDVVFGATLGAVTARAYSIGHKEYLDSKEDKTVLRFVPLPVDDGFGVAVVYGTH